MSPNREIFRTFRTADKSIELALKYYYYVYASERTASPHIRYMNLPRGGTPLTHNWNKTVSPQKIIDTMYNEFDSYHHGVCLVDLTNILSTALEKFFKKLAGKDPILGLKYDDKFFRLAKKGDIKCVSGSTPNYESLLKIASDIVISKKDDLFGGVSRNKENKKYIDWVPDVCLDVDDARRLRNCFVHHNRLFNDSYKNRTIYNKDNLRKLPELHQRFSKYQDDEIYKEVVISRHQELRHQFSEYKKNKGVLIKLSPRLYVEFVRSHGDFLHDLHDIIQRHYFDIKKSGYSYGLEHKKGTEWYGL